MPRRQKQRGVDNPKRRGKAPPFWSLGVQGRDRNAPAVLLGGSKALLLPRPADKIKKAAFLKNPLDKWIPRAIMQPTSEELQTYDGEK